MGYKKVFTDDSEHGSKMEMEFFINTNNRLYIEIAEPNDTVMFGFIALDKENVVKFMELKRTLKDFE